MLRGHSGWHGDGARGPRGARPKRFTGRHERGREHRVHTGREQDQEMGGVGPLRGPLEGGHLGGPVRVRGSTRGRDRGFNAEEGEIVFRRVCCEAMILNIFVPRHRRQTTRSPRTATRQNLWIAAGPVLMTRSTPEGVCGGSRTPEGVCGGSRAPLPMPAGDEVAAPGVCGGSRTPEGVCGGSRTPAPGVCVRALGASTCCLSSLSTLRASTCRRALRMSHVTCRGSRHWGVYVLPLAASSAEGRLHVACRCP